MLSHSFAADLTWKAVSQCCSDVFTKQELLYFYDSLTMKKNRVPPVE